jgi:hypothetical protein
MKKLLKTIAMILIVAMLATSVTDCCLADGGYNVYGGLKPIAIGIDVCLLAIVVYCVVGIVHTTIKVGKKFSKYNFNELSVQIEQSPFIEALAALPDTCVDALAQKVRAVPETEMAYFMESISNIPQNNINLKLDSASEIELFNTVEYLNSLSQAQFITLFENMRVELKTIEKHYHPIVKKNTSPIGQNSVRWPFLVR